MNKQSENIGITDEKFMAKHTLGQQPVTTTTLYGATWTDEGFLQYNKATLPDQGYIT